MSASKPNKDAACRLKYARNFTGFARTVFCKIHNISSNTLAAWENGTTYFSEDAAKKLSNFLYQDGIVVNYEWIMTGEGPEPFSPTNKKSYTNFISSKIDATEEFLWQATNSFKKYYKNSLTLVMQDDTALPFCKPGDHIDGKIIELENNTPIEKEPFIVELENGSLMLRYIELTSKFGLYNLKTINQDALIGAKIKSIKIRRVAQINWIFRP